jgi:hypothetical protein
MHLSAVIPAGGESGRAADYSALSRPVLFDRESSLSPLAGNDRALDTTQVMKSNLSIPVTFDLEACTATSTITTP